MLTVHFQTLSNKSSCHFIKVYTKINFKDSKSYWSACWDSPIELVKNVLTPNGVDCLFTELKLKKISFLVYFALSLHANHNL